MASPAAVPARELSSIDFAAMIGGPLRAVVDAQSQAALSSVEFIKQVGFKPPAEDDPTGSTSGEPIYVRFRYPKEISPYSPAVSAAVIGVTVSKEGSYTEDGEKSFSFSTPSGGTPATGTATVQGGKIVRVELTDPGSGYTSAPSDAEVDGAGTKGKVKATFRPARDAEPAQFADMELEVPILTMLPIPFIRVEEAKIDFNAKINSVEHADVSSVVKGSSQFSAGHSVGVSGPFGLGPKASTSVNFKVSASYQRNSSSGYKVDRTYSLAVHIRAVQDEMPAGLERILGILEDAIQATPIDA